MNEGGYPYQDEANLAAVLEKYFDGLYEFPRNLAGDVSLERAVYDAIFQKMPQDLTEEERSAYLEKADELASRYSSYTLVNTSDWENHKFRDSPSCQEKGLVVKDRDGNLYVHYRGTGDGNWGFNAAVYGTEVSEVQKWAVDFYEEALSKCAKDGEPSNIYVLGHSQGGNNAQYVTLHAPDANRITACISMDGPGHSSASLDEVRQRDLDYYERQRNKIYAYNGWSDYVSCLGQEQVVPSGHVFYVETRDDPVNGPMFAFHSSECLMDEENRLGPVHRAGENPEQPFRKFVVALNQRVLQLPPEQQPVFADAIMEICERYVGSNEPFKGELSHFELLKPMLVSVVLDTLEECPELLQPVLRQLGVEGMIFPGAPDGQVVSTLVMYLLRELNALPQDVRKDALTHILGFLTVQENGNLYFDTDGFRAQLAANGLEEKLKSVLVSVLLDIAEEQPEVIQAILERLNLDSMLFPEAPDGQVVSTLVMDLVRELDSLPPDMRRAALEYALRFLTVREDGTVGLDTEKFREHLISNGLEGLVKVWPIIQDTLVNNPGDVLNLLHALKVDEMIVDFIKDHPVQAVGITIVSALVFPFIRPVLSVPLNAVLLVESVITIIKAGYAIFEKVPGIVRKAADFVVNCLHWVGDTCGKIARWLHEQFNAGARYAQDYPYFKADTTMLRTCADRVRSVNERLSRLDSDLRGLYWQVGFLDLWDIFSANLLTGYSPTLRQVESWLRDAAGQLEDADWKACRNF